MNETSLVPPRRHPLELRLPPLAVVFVLMGLAWIGEQIAPQLTASFPARAEIALALACAGLGISALGVASFRRARTTVNPTKPQSSTQLVVGGVYRFTRNPMYLGFLGLLAAWVVWLGNPLGLLVLPAFIAYLNRFQIRPEEATLRVLFANEFIDYSRRVRRWL